MKRIVLLFQLLLCAAVWCTSVMAAPKNCPYDINCSIVYTSLSEQEKTFFDDLYDALWGWHNSVDIPRGMTIDDASYVMLCLENECPELFPIVNGMFWDSYKYNGQELYSRVQFARKGSHRSQQRFIQEVSDTASDLLSIFDIHQYICQRYSYKTGAEDWDDYAIVSTAMESGLANCVGYARTMTMFCHFAGFTCSHVYGAPETDHVWNMVCVNGKYTFVDVGGDDAGNYAVYDYLGFSSEEAVGVHTVDSEWNRWAPHCEHVPRREFMENRDLGVPEEGILAASGTYGRHTYQVYEGDLSWQEAEDFCRSIGGHLVSIRDDREMDFILRLAEGSQRDNFWIGLYRSDLDQWTWTDGSGYDFSSWDDKQPDNYQNMEHFVRFPNKDLYYMNWTAAKGKWNDTCGDGDDEAPLSSFGFICELP
jgi:hypothetical protein